MTLGKFHNIYTSIIKKISPQAPVVLHSAHHKDDQRSEAPLPQWQAEGVGATSPGEENAPKRPCSGLLVPKGELQEIWGGSFC